MIRLNSISVVVSNSGNSLLASIHYSEGLTTGTEESREVEGRYLD